LIYTEKRVGPRTEPCGAPIDTARGAEVLAGVGVARWKAWPVVKNFMLIEILDYRRSIGGDSVSYPQCSGQLGGGALVLHGLYSVPELFGISVTGSKFLFEKALAFLTD
jgi:hypothetical protein